MIKAESLLNKSLPYIIHVDLNSCFAIMEQQANKLLRGRPVGVAAYDTPKGFVLAASYEAKAKGVVLGVNNEQARTLCPDIVILTPDPGKYREAHRRFKAVMLEYTPDVVAKSIDEFVLDMRASPALRNAKSEIRNSKQAQNTKRSNIKPDTAEHERDVHNTAMRRIALDMKKRIAESLGEFVTVNIGISTNRFLAKYAAGFGKPDGMLLIDHINVEKWYLCGEFHECATDPGGCKPMQLVDLPGINVRYRARLRNAGIYTPTDFLAAELQMLKKRVFKSINGLHWYNRLRGYEADNYETQRRTIGHQYALKEKTTDIEKLERLLMKLCEKTGRRLRKNNYYATGIHLYLGFDRYRDGFGSDDAYVKKEWASNESNASEAAGFNQHKFRKWSHGEKVYHRLYATSDIYEAARKLLLMAVNQGAGGVQDETSFGASTKHGANGIEIPSREYWRVQAENSSESSSTASSAGGQARRPGLRQNVKIMSVNVFGLEPWDPEQLSLFDMPENIKGQEVDFTNRAIDAKKRLSDSVDAVNNRYGEFVITPGTMIDMSGTILDRIAFGQVRDF